MDLLEKGVRNSQVCGMYREKEVLKQEDHVDKGKTQPDNNIV